MTIKIEVAYASESEQALLSLDVVSGTTVGEAIKKSGILEKFSDLAIGDMQFGIYSKKVDADTILQEYDRIEIYRELKISPKEARRLRAKL